MDLRPKVNLHLELNSETEYVCIEYPGMVKDKEKMLENFDGIGTIEKTFNNKTSRLALRLRPQDPCCKPILANRKLSKSWVLRVKRYRRKNKKEDEFCYRADFCGYIGTTYQFTAMCEYQYLPLVRGSAKDDDDDQLRSVVKDVSLREACTRLEGSNKVQEMIDFDALLFLPPFIFSRVDTEQQYNFKDTTPQLGNKQTQYHASRYAYGIKITDEVPTKPMDEAVKYRQYVDVQCEDYYQRTKNLFMERPIWSKPAIQCKLNIPQHHLVQVLPCFAFYYTSGPWRTFWVRLGYDPMQNPAACHYQLVDFRIRQRRNRPTVPIPVRRSTFSHRPLSRVEKTSQSYDRRDLFGASTSSTSRQEQPSGKALALTSIIMQENEAYMFKPGRLPAYRQIFYQLCDIHMQEVHDVVAERKIEKPCLKDGWLLPDTVAMIRDILDVDIKQTTNRLYLSNGKQQQATTNDVVDDDDDNAEESLDEDDDEDELEDDEEDIEDVDDGKEDNDEDEENEDDDDDDDEGKLGEKTIGSIRDLIKPLAYNDD